MPKERIARAAIDQADQRAAVAEQALQKSVTDNVQLLNAYQNTMLILACVLKEHHTDPVTGEIRARFNRATMDAVVLKKISHKFQQYVEGGEKLTDENKDQGMAYTDVICELSAGELESAAERARSSVVLTDAHGRPKMPGDPKLIV